MSLKKISLVPTFIVLFLAGCEKPKLALEPTLALPIASSNLNVFDLLARFDSSEVVVVDENTKAIGVSYTSKIQELSAEELVAVPDQDFGAQYSFGNVPTPPQGTPITIIGTDVFDLSVDKISLFAARLSEGKLRMQANSSYDHDIAIEVTFPTILIGGDAAQMTLQINKDDNPREAQGEISLRNADVGLTDQGQPEKLRMNYTITLISSGVGVSQNDNISISTSISDVEFDELDASTNSLNMPFVADSVLLKIFRNTNLSNLEYEFDDPTLEIGMTNYFETPLELQINKLVFAEVESGESTELTFTGIPNPIPVKAGLASGVPSNTTVEFNSGNSNISDILSPYDKYMTFDVNGKMDTKGKRISIESTDKFSMDMNVTLPLKGLVEGWGISSVVDLNFPGDEDMVSSGGIRLYVENHLPIHFFLQAVFLDKNDEPLDSLFSDFVADPSDTTLSNVIRAGAVDDDGFTIAEEVSIIDVPMSSERLGHLFSAEKVEISVEVFTQDADEGKKVSIRTTDYANVKLGLKAKFNDLLNDEE